MNKGSGWHALEKYRKLGQFMEPVIPSAWETLLKQMGMTEQAAMWELRLLTNQGNQLRSWVRQNHNKRFVPPEVLQELRIHVWNG